MAYTEHYDDLIERQQRISEAEANGFVMLHDDFDADWQKGDQPHGTLTFDLPTPKTDEELQMELIVRETEEANDQALVAYLNFNSLTLDQIKIVVKALLGDFISRNQSRYIGVL